MKIWAKVMRADKILRDVLYEGEHPAGAKGFREAVQAVSYAADVSTPVILPAHYERFERFNRVKFLPSDFIEEVDFTSFVIERVTEDGKKQSAPKEGRSAHEPAPRPRRRG